MSFSVDHHFFSPTSCRKARPASMSSSGFHSQRRRLAFSQPPSVDNLETFNGDMTRRSEKEILQTLNDRFAGYIDKVRTLEMHNRNLEAEAAALRQNQASRTSIGERYERELGDLRGLLQELTGEKGRAALEHEHLEEDVQHLRDRLEDEARNREELEAAARAMKKYVEECRLARLDLDKKLRALEEEDAFLKKNHEEEVADLLAQIQGAQMSFEVRDTLKADLTGALREIRAQLDNHASRNSTQAEEWFKVRIERLSDAARSNQDALRGTQEEITEYRRQLQSRTIELETLRGTKESLERQRMESDERHHDDLNSLQETINQLDNELKNTKWEMASQLKDYQELLNVKMALDIEIAAYRKLLEGEEDRFLSGGSPYSYLESRIFKVKGDEMSDTVIVEEQTDETQVTEVTEEADEEEEEEDVEEEEAEEEEEETKEDKGEEKEDEREGKEDGKGEEKSEEEDAGKEKVKSKDKGESPPSKYPQPKSPAAKSPESKSPAAKSPMPKSPPSKSPASKSPQSKSPPKTPEIKSPEKEKAKLLVIKDTPKDEKKEEKPQPVKEETKEKEQPVKEKTPETKEKEKKDKPDEMKESKVDEAPMSEDTSKHASPSKPADDKPAPKSEPKESIPPVAEEKPSPPKPEKAESKAEPAPKAEPENTQSKKEDKKLEEKPTPKAKPEEAENKKEDKKPKEKQENTKEEKTQVKEGGKAEKTEKSSGTESKESKEEKMKK